MIATRGQLAASRRAAASRAAPPTPPVSATDGGRDLSMNGTRRPALSERDPTRFLSAAVLLTMAVVGWFGWNTYHSYRLTRVFRDQYLRLQEKQGQIIHLDEVLTMS